MRESMTRQLVTILAGGENEDESEGGLLAAYKQPDKKNPR